jgi:hypothetical protein
VREHGHRVRHLRESERVRDYLVGQYGDAADGVEFRLDDGSRWRVLAERGFNGTSWVEEG